jgi:hypothetical protein
MSVEVLERHNPFVIIPELEMIARNREVYQDLLPQLLKPLMDKAMEVSINPSTAPGLARANSKSLNIFSY